MKNRFYHSLIVIMCVTAVATGCGQKGEGKAASPSADAQQQLTISAFYGNPDGTKLVKKDVQIRYGGAAEKYVAALNALRTSPDKDSFPLADALTFKTAKISEGNVTLDASLKADGSLGANGESLLLDAMKQTMFQFDEVKTFDLLIDGKQVESLMGHKDLPHPFQR